MFNELTDEELQEQLSDLYEQENWIACRIVELQKEVDSREQENILDHRLKG